jgi:hypothetical protein
MHKGKTRPRDVTVEWRRNEEDVVTAHERITTPLDAAITELRDCWRYQLRHWAGKAWPSDLSILPDVSDADLRLWRAIYHLREVSGEKKQYYRLFRLAIRLGKLCKSRGLSDSVVIHEMLVT